MDRELNNLEMAVLGAMLMCTNQCLVLSAERQDDIAKKEVRQVKRYLKKLSDMQKEAIAFGNWREALRFTTVANNYLHFFVLGLERIETSPDSEWEGGLLDMSKRGISRKDIMDALGTIKLCLKDVTGESYEMSLLKAKAKMANDKERRREREGK